MPNVGAQYVCLGPLCCRDGSWWERDLCPYCEVAIKVQDVSQGCRQLETCGNLDLCESMKSATECVLSIEFLSQLIRLD